MKHCIFVTFLVAYLSCGAALAKERTSGCVGCHSDEAKLKSLVAFVAPAGGEGEG